MVSRLYRFATYFCLLSTLGFNLAAFALYVYGRRMALTPTYNALATIATEKEKQVDQWFRGYKQDLVRDLTNEQAKQAALTLLTTRLTAEPDYQAAYQFLSTYFSPPKPNRESSFLLTQGGIVIFSTAKDEEGRYQPLQNTSTYFTLDKIYTVKPIFYQSSITQKPEITFVVPVFDDQDRRIGAYATVLNLQNLDDVVRSPTRPIPPATSVSTYLVGNLSRVDNALIAPPPRRSPSAESKAPNPEELSSLTALDYIVDSPGITEVLQGTRGNFAYLDYRGEPVLGVYRWLPDYHLGLMVETDQAIVFRQAEQRASWLYGLGLILNLPLALLLITVFKPRPLQTHASMPPP
ncbi:MAG: hypothetical protein VKL20_01740 [Synechocystis sp.]|nr:hypothetical protein [Synechocystis sp.]